MSERSGGTTPPIGDLAEQFIRLLVTGFVGGPAERRKQAGRRRRP
jgi:hypothetical protein